MPITRQEAEAITDACMILDVVRNEWDDAWSTWDESVRDRLGEMLTSYHATARAYERVSPTDCEESRD